MKKLVFIFSLFTLLFGCFHESGVLTPFEQVEYKYFAFKSLSDKQKKTIINDWRDAHVYQGNYQKFNCGNAIVIDSEETWCFGLVDRNRELSVNQILLGVAFNTIDDALLGPIIVIIDYDIKDVIGYVPRF